MRLLLDSHTALWWMKDPTLLKPAARLAIASPENEVLISSVSLWELGLKVSKGKLKLPPDFPSFLARDGIENLPFTAAHAWHSTQLPQIHGDPFDRALIAQCQLESLTFATRDGLIPQYNISVLAV